MTSKLGGNHHSELAKTNKASDTKIQNESDEKFTVKIDELSIEQLKKCNKKISSGLGFFRLQRGSHGGSNIFFNQQGSDCRYNLLDGKTGTMYLAYSPETAIKEVFQKRISLKESDLDEFYMGRIILKKDINLLDLNSLIRCSNITLNDVTSSTRKVTQKLACVIYQAGFDGIRYLSNVTGSECLVLWNTDVSGKGMVLTAEQKPLSSWDFGNDKEAADILVDELNISVEAD